MMPFPTSRAPSPESDRNAHDAQPDGLGIDHAAVAAADRLAEAVHAGQVDKMGRPYIEHVRWVRDRLASEPGVSTDQLVAAVLHDAIEDGGLSEQALVERGVSPIAARYVAILSRRQDESYNEFIDRVCREGGRPVARIKLQDVRHHLERNAGLAAIDPWRAASLLRRYQQAHSRLTAFIADREKVGEFGVTHYG